MGLFLTQIILAQKKKKKDAPSPRAWAGNNVHTSAPSSYRRGEFFCSLVGGNNSLVTERERGTSILRPRLEPGDSFCRSRVDGDDAFANF